MAIRLIMLQVTLWAVDVSFCWTFSVFFPTIKQWNSPNGNGGQKGIFDGPKWVPLVDSNSPIVRHPVAAFCCESTVFVAWCHPSENYNCFVFGFPSTILCLARHQQEKPATWWSNQGQEVMRSTHINCLCGLNPSEKGLLAVFFLSWLCRFW